MTNRMKGLAIVALAVASVVSAGCGALFSSSDSPASLTGRVTGVPVGAGGASAHAASSSAGAAAVTVTVAENESLTANVDEDGTFTLSGLPASGFTLIFRCGRQEA